MQLETIDWVLVGFFFAVYLVVGIVVTKRASKSASEFFLSGRSMPWWLLGFSMVATTFAADTPLLVTNIVRQKGVAGNWEWWAFLLTGMTTVFIYAKLWRRSAVLTDIEFYEVRYSGKPAAFLRGFRSLYLGAFFNIMIMANVTLAGTKIGEIMLGFSPIKTILLACVITAVLSAAGGFLAVLLVDFLMFLVAMVGAIGAAVIAVQHADVGGLSNLFADTTVQGKLPILPPFDFSDPEQLSLLITIFIIPLTVQWWSVWYPGAEPGGGGYIAQRMLAAKNERHATGATLFFNVMHYALRPWPWILVALASLIVFPDLESLKRAFPHISPERVQDDLAYPAMLTFLPTGLKGIVVSSLIAAYMSTIATHLNWGSSYIVNDFWKRFLRPNASEWEFVQVGRVATVLLMAVAAFVALQLESAYQGFQILLQIGAGTGLLFLLRWFWWRINPYSEIAAMVVSFAVAVWMHFFPPAWLPEWGRLLMGVGITTVAWIVVTLITPPSTQKTLVSFYRLVNPGGIGWRPVLAKAAAEGDAVVEAPSKLGLSIACAVIGCVAVYCALFATGYWLYGKYTSAAVLTTIAVVASAFLIRTWGKVNAE